MKNKRLIYSCTFAAFLAVEVLIALFVHDSFIRPYIGDVLVVPLMAAFLRILFPSRPILLPLYATLFAFAVELLQFFDVVNLLGLSESTVISTVIGRTFDIADLICYAIGGVLFSAAEQLMLKSISNQDK